jgi:heterodisulfide reductase subunit A
LNIELLTLSEVIDVQGKKGNFSVTVKKHPRYVDMDKCIACGLCAEKCPKKVDDPFNMGLNKRKAAYIQYGQTVPLKYAIDPQHCIYLTKGKCRACEKFCPTGAIDFEDREQEVQLQVGAMILAPGFQAFDPSGVDIYGYDHIPDVVTSLEYERLLSSSGPCMGHLERPSDNKEPQKIAWIQCVGSRNTNQCANGYCSSVCCMYAIKQAQVTAEHVHGEVPEQTIFFMDMRTHGKEFERYFEEARSKGIDFVRSRPHTVLPGPRNQGAVLHYVTEDGTVLEKHYDLVVLSVGLEPAEDAQKLARIVGFNLDHYGFAAAHAFAPVSSSVDGVFVTGAFEAPMAIPRSVTQASTAASEVSKALLPAKNTLTQEKTYPQEKEISDQDIRVGVFVCSCGINIAGVVDVQEVAEYARGLPHVQLVENNLFTCSTDTQDLIAKKIKEHNLNRIVIAACTPRTHEPLFQDTLKEAGLNAYMVEMANIRNHNAWVHQKEPAKATAKAKDQVRMAVAKVVRNQPLSELEVNVTQKALVIGGGAAGMTAALELADQGYPAVLIEKSDHLGGNALHLRQTSGGEDAAAWVRELIQQVQAHQGIEVLTQTALNSTTGSVGSFQSTVDVNGQARTLDYGAAIVATGAVEHKPDTYLYGHDNRVMTHLEFDRFLQESPQQAAGAKSVVFIQCVGSRIPKRMYCSRICCMHTMHAAISLKEDNPDMKVFVLYRDIRTYGKHEDLYTKARQLGVVFLRYDLGNEPQVDADQAGLQVRTFDPILQQDVEISASYLVLATAIVPGDFGELVDLYKCGLNQDGFVNEAHPKLRPVDMTVDGLFVAGLCNYPKTLSESISQAKAAASRAGVILSRSVMKLDAIKSYVTERCDGCALCVDVCPYQAISLETVFRDGTEHKTIAIDKALCKGCGLCEATCPKDGVLVHGFTLDQMRSQVDAALAG